MKFQNSVQFRTFKVGDYVFRIKGINQTNHRERHKIIIHREMNCCANSDNSFF